MTWPFENDTGVIVRKLAKRSLASEKRRNLMVVIAVALALIGGYVVIFYDWKYTDNCGRMALPNINYVELPMRTSDISSGWRL